MLLITQRRCFTEAHYILYIYLYVYVQVYLCLNYLIYFSIIIFIFIIINHIISLKKTNLFFGQVCQNFSLRVLLSFCLVVCQFESGVAYKRVAYKRSVHSFLSNKSFIIFKKLFSEAVGRRCSVKNVFLKIQQKSQENKFHRPQACNIIKKEILTQVFYCEFC